MHFGHPIFCMIYQNANINKNSTINISKNLYNSLSENTVGERIRKMRILNNISQSELAKLTNFKRGTIDGYERGTAYPSPKRLIEIAESLNANIEYFYDEYYAFIFSDFKNILKEFRKANNLTLRDLKRHGFSSTSWCDWENGNFMNRVSYKKILSFIESKI